MNPADVVTVPREPTEAMLAAVDGFTVSFLVAEDDTEDRQLSEDDCAEIYRNMIAAAPASEPGEAVALGYIDPSQMDALRQGVGIVIGPASKMYGRSLPLYAAPPSTAALTNPKDSDAEASLRALLAELRGLTRYRTYYDGAWHEHRTGEAVQWSDVAALISRYPEAK